MALRAIASLIGVALLGILATPALAEPASIAARRAQIARIQRGLEAIDAQVGRAAEEFNGARYRLEQVRRRIGENQRELTLAGRNLKLSRAILMRRVREIYRQGDPTMAEVLLSSSSIAGVVDRMDLLDRIGRQDAEIVGNIRHYRTRARLARLSLLKDRGAAHEELAAAGRHKARVEGLLRQRRQVLAGAKGQLGQMLAAEHARERREAEYARRQAIEAQRAAAQSAVVGAFASAAPAVPIPSGDGNAAVVGIAMRYLGVPYVWGGATPSGFDCSGLASYVYAEIGKSVPHYTGAIWSQFPKVPADQLQAGDMVFYNGLGHMGIYIGGGQYIHAPHTGDVVKISSMSDRGDFVGAVRP